MKKVLVGGCFDILHFGHISFLKEARKKGDYLVVLLESDEHLRKHKGPNRPIHTQEQRKEMLEALEFVDEVISLPVMKEDKDYFDLVQKINPNVLATTEGDPIGDKKRKQAELVGAEYVELSYTKGASTSKILSKF